MGLVSRGLLVSSTVSLEGALGFSEVSKLCFRQRNTTYLASIIRITNAINIPLPAIMLLTADDSGHTSSITIESSNNSIASLLCLDDNQQS